VRKINLNSFQVASNETVRDINSRIMLNLVRKHQPVSRADLMRYSGLQRSTVSAITERLLADRWLREGALGHLPRGRKPTYLHLNADRCGVVGVDVQPGATRLAIASLASEFLAHETMSTPKDPRDFISALARRLTHLLRAHTRSWYEGVGISLPGRIDPATGRVMFAPTLGWQEVDLKTSLECAVGLPVTLDNAANACALAELWSRRHIGEVNNLVAVTICDDISVGLVMNGQLVRGTTGIAGEFGHVAQMLDGPKCRCGNNGCWEALASNAAAVGYYAEAASARKGAIGSKSDMATVPFDDLLRLADKGDTHAAQALAQMAQHLGNGLAMLVTGLAPDVLVVVGEVTRAWSKVGPWVDAALKRRSSHHTHTRIVVTDPDSQPRLQGSIAMVLQKHFSAPVIA
jgi:predicted NBD/HSP70 family sugar kinase